MKAFSFAKVVAMLAVVGLVFSSAPAHAWTKSEAKCRATISKGLGKYVSTAQKAIGGCHKNRDKGKVGSGTDCNDISVADTKNKVPGAGNKLRGSIDGAKSKCKDKKTGVTYDAVLANFGRCPSPANGYDDGGATDGIDDFGELGDCLVALANAAVEQSARDILGSPTGLDKGQAKCHGTLPKAYMKWVDTVAKERGKAQAGRDKALDPAVWNQGSYDGKGKIAKARAKAMSSIDKGCGSLSKVELNALGSCGDTASDLKDCIDEIVGAQAGGLVAAQWELPGNCATGARVFVNAGTGVQLTNTSLDIGWTGLGHGVDVLDGFHGSVSLACDADCKDCDVTIDPMKDRADGYCRCANDPTVRCDTIEGADADDCGGNMCHCTFGPPLALSSAGNPVCIQNKLTAELDGEADMGTGHSETTVTMNSVVRIGISASQPCPTCDGDPTPNDGVRGGACDGGSRNGQSCDENGDHPTFGPTSYECPSDGANISGTGLSVILNLTDSPISMGFDTQCDSPYNGFDCACATCSGNSALPCNSDAECSATGAGTCTSNGGGANRWPNACSDGVCTDGTCLAGPVDSYCDGALRANGNGFITCVADADCDTMAGECQGGDCGSCSLTKTRACFNDPITAEGVASQNGSELVSNFCTAPSSSAAINAATGSPGPSTVKLDFDYLGICGSGQQYEAPGGSNCN